MAELTKADDDVMTTLKELIGRHHPHLAAVSDQIAVLFREKAGKVGDVIVAGKTMKAPGILKTLGDQEYTFIIELAYDYWLKLTETQRISLLDHHLCACGAEENEETEEVRYFVATPDVAFFSEEIQRRGFWRAKGSVADEGRNAILDLFGPESAESAAAQAAVGLPK